MRRRKILTTSVVAALLLCAPLQLAAEERAAPAAGRAAVFDWLAGLWSELAARLASEEVPPPARSGATIDGSCAVDPFGCPDGR